MSAAVTVGRMVHYHSFHGPGGEESKPRAAIVTSVSESGERVSLAVYGQSGMSFKRVIAYSETPAPGCWSWPPRD